MRPLMPVIRCYRAHFFALEDFARKLIGIPPSFLIGIPPLAAETDRHGGYFIFVCKCVEN